MGFKQSIPNPLTTQSGALWRQVAECPAKSLAQGQRPKGKGLFSDSLEFRRVTRRAAAPPSLRGSRAGVSISCHRISRGGLQRAECHLGPYECNYSWSGRTPGLGAQSPVRARDRCFSPSFSFPSLLSRINKKEKRFGDSDTQSEVQGDETLPRSQSREGAELILHTRFVLFGALSPLPPPDSEECV